jgi:hypothetical protein
VKSLPWTFLEEGSFNRLIPRQRGEDSSKERGEDSSKERGEDSSKERGEDSSKERGEEAVLKYSKFSRG